MAYKVIDIEGVGSVYAEKLTAAGVVTVAQLLEKCAAPAGRKALAEATEIPEKVILRWANHADLMRVKGAKTTAEVIASANSGDKDARNSHCGIGYPYKGRN